MSITPNSPDPAVRGKVKTWVNSQWKFMHLPGQLSAEINSAAIHDNRSLGILVKVGGATKGSDIETIRETHTKVNGHWGSFDATVEGFKVLSARGRAQVMAENSIDAYVTLLRARITNAAKSARR